MNVVEDVGPPEEDKMIKRDILLLCSGWIGIGVIPRMVGIIETKAEFFYLILSLDVIISAAFLFALFYILKEVLNKKKGE